MSAEDQSRVVNWGGKQEALVAGKVVPLFIPSHVVCAGVK